VKYCVRCGVDAAVAGVGERLPLGWLFVGGLTIAIITALKAFAEELAATNERQRILFQELQHRVANTLQSVVRTLETARRRVDSAPSDAKRILAEGAQRSKSRPKPEPR
jgi:hypothetical protein